MALIVLLYLLMGGFRAVVKADVLQYVAMIFILFVFVSHSSVKRIAWGCIDDRGFFEVRKVSECG